MKHFCYFFATLLVGSMLLTSCLNGEQYSTPSIQASYLYRSTPAGVRDTIHYGDTVSVGDTLLGNLLLYGVYNNLTEFQVTADTSAVALELLTDSAYQPFLLADSDPKNGLLRFTMDVYIFPTALQYVVKKPGTHRISLTLASTAGEKYSPINAWFEQPVK